jgi:hypothetical protein
MVTLCANPKAEREMSKQMVVGFIVSCSALFAAVSLMAGDILEGLDNCNVAWNSPSNNQDGFMPIGNVEVGLECPGREQWRT